MTTTAENTKTNKAVSGTVVAPSIMPRDNSNEFLDKIKERSKILSNSKPLAFVSQVEDSLRKFPRRISIWAILGVIAMFAAENIPSFVEDYPTVYNVATFGLSLLETIMNYVTECAIDAFEILKAIPSNPILIFTGSFKLIYAMFKNLSIFGTLL